MLSRNRVVILAAVVAGVLAVPTTASADHATRPHTDNMHAKGESPHPATFLGDPDGVRHINSDIAFEGRLAFNGNYDGIRIIDISDPDNPQEIVHQHCNGDQGDIVVWKNILVRSWNSKKTTPRTCDGQTVPAGWEGVHVFDISNVTDPELVASVELPCGSHTVTLAPDLANNRLIVYSNNSSSAGCGVGLDLAGQNALGDFIDVIEVPIDHPENSHLLHREALAGPADPTVRTGCHDMGVILGSVNLATCASADTTNVFDIGENSMPGGSLADPEFLYTIQEPGVDGHRGRWHSASFTWDGKVIILGWEPGGGAAPECESTDPALTKSAFFYDAGTGAKLGQWTLPRAQDGALLAGVKIDENCTIHNYNVVPLRNGRYVLTGGNYQAGTWVTDFSNPANPVTLGWSDPPVLVRQTPTGPASELGGAWSSYWYNNFIYESSITEGLNLFRFSGNETGSSVRLDRLNPQTQEFSIG
jgi:LVIVD repeat